jgi:hypothetical protein
MNNPATSIKCILRHRTECHFQKISDLEFLEFGVPWPVSGLRTYDIRTDFWPLMVYIIHIPAIHAEFTPRNRRCLMYEEGQYFYLFCEGVYITCCRPLASPQHLAFNNGNACYLNHFSDITVHQYLIFHSLHPLGL